MLLTLWTTFAQFVPSVQHLPSSTSRQSCQSELLQCVTALILSTVASLSLASPHLAHSARYGRAVHSAVRHTMLGTRTCQPQQQHIGSFLLLCRLGGHSLQLCFDVILDTQCTRATTQHAASSSLSQASPHLALKCTAGAGCYATTHCISRWTGSMPSSAGTETRRLPGPTHYPDALVACEQRPC